MSPYCILRSCLIIPLKRKSIIIDLFMIYVLFSGFDTLCIDDRVTLTKCSIYRNVLILCSTRYDLETGRHYVFGWRSWREGPQKLVDTCCEYQVLFIPVYHLELGSLITCRLFDKHQLKLLKIGIGGLGFIN